jgi:hypothetical protein
MKYFSICFIIIFDIISSQNSIDVKKNCTIPEGKEECCWTNPNSCCIKPSEGEKCFDALTQCCKNKNGTIYYENDPIKITIYYQAIKINWIIILLAFIFVI